MNEAGPRDAAESMRRTRVRALLLLTVAFIAAGAAWGWHWWRAAQFREDTDNAYVGGNIVPVMPRIAGTVVQIDADETMRVDKGQELVRLDDSVVRIALQSAEAQLAEAARGVRRMFDERERLRASVTLRQSELEKAEQDLGRREALLARRMVAQEELEHARSVARTARAAVALAQRELQAAQTLIANTSVETHPTVLRAAAQVRQAAIDIGRTVIVAPVAGQVARRSVQLGQRVDAGDPLLAIVPLDELWVDANFKEQQLRNMRIGQKVDLHADLYGKDVRYTGTVAGLGAGTGSVFALLPAQNATGNWIKIVQRVPVRVMLDPRQVRERPLRIGLSMVARVDTHDRKGPVLAPVAPREGLYRTEVFRRDATALEARIAGIIRDNGGGEEAPVAPGVAVVPR
ncbi:MAG: HlyD family efflux transporter periplasmic adaptor subunit [Gammaproteobacteria bacterium]